MAKFFDRQILHNNIKGDRIAIFISIPRNASNSVRLILKLGPNRNEENTSSLIIHENHQRAAILNQKYDMNNLFVFCFSRNPFDRCVSWYYYHKNIEPYKSLTFESWVKQGIPHHWKLQNQTDYYSEGITPLVQYNFIEHNKVDFIGKRENFSRDLKIIIERLNFICEANGLSHRFKFVNKMKNRTKRKKDYRGYYTEQTMGIVYSLLKKDFEYFGYEK